MAEYNEGPIQASIDASEAGALAASDGTVAGELVKVGAINGLSGAATGVVTANVAFTNDFPTATDNVQLTILTPSAQAIVFGGLWVTAVTNSGFTINANVTTADAGSTFDVGWLALGH